MIPYLFHFIWLQGFDVCPFKNNYNQCQKMNPKVQFYFWDESSILKLFDTTPWIPYRDEIKKLYLNEKVLAGKADIARYAIMYVYGGVYIDMDYQCVQSFVPILDAYGSKIDLAVVLTKDFLYYIKPLLLGKSKGKCLNNGFFACKPQHEIMKYVLENCFQNKRQKIIIYRTGTFNFYQSFQKIFQNENKFKTLILPKMYYQPLETFYCDYKAQGMNDSVMVHSNNFSYKSQWIRSILKVSPRTYLYILFIVLLTILFIVYIATKKIIVFGIFCSVIIIFVVCFVINKYYSHLIKPKFDKLEKTIWIKNDKYDKLMVVAHPDDELLFGGLAILREPGWKVICLTNGYKPKRTLAFMDAMGSIDNVWAYEIWNHSDQWFGTKLHKKIESNIQEELGTRDYLKIVTHNINGEYGHRQHALISKLLHKLVKKNLNVFYHTLGGFGSATAEENNKLTFLINKFYKQEKISKHIKKSQYYYILPIN